MQSTAVTECSDITEESKHPYPQQTVCPVGILTFPRCPNNINHYP
jgi:hypothetical protein